jgi:anti-sigma-K factor RskA
VSHLEPDRLVLIALGVDASLSDETDHVTNCPSCRTQLEDLQVVATLSTETQEVRDLPPPPDRVWAAVAAALEAPPAPRRRFPRTVVVALAAGIVAVVATVGVTRFVDRRPSTPVAAQATLDRFGAAPAGAHGDARVVGGSELRLHVSGMPLQPGFYEVWLLDPDSGRMIAVGTMGAGQDATMPLPANVNLRVYRTIDVSAEEYDGNPGHSGRSMLRGTLTN